MNWEDYLIENTNVLKNKFGITDQDELSDLENLIVIAKLSYIHDHGFNGEYDERHLCRLHEFLFSDIYSFAGCYREVEMFKKYGGFLKPSLISSELSKVMNYYKNKEFVSESKFEIAMFLADYYYDLIMIHPFREGNGRTIREFIRQFVNFKFKEYDIDFQKMNKKNLLQGVVEHDYYPNFIALEMYNALTLKEKKMSK